MKLLIKKNKLLLTILFFLVCVSCALFAIANKDENVVNAESSSNSSDLVLSLASSNFGYIDSSSLKFDFSIKMSDGLKEKLSSVISYDFYMVREDSLDFYYSIKDYHAVSSLLNDFIYKTLKDSGVYYCICDNSFSVSFSNFDFNYNYYVFVYSYSEFHGGSHNIPIEYDEYTLHSVSNVICLNGDNSKNYYTDFFKNTSFQNIESYSNQFRFWQKALNIYNSTERANLTINYKIYDNNISSSTYKKIIDKQKIVSNVNSLFLQNKAYMLRYLHLDDTHIGENYNNGYWLSDFVVKRDNVFYDDLLSQYITSSSIVLNTFFDPYNPDTEPFIYSYDKSDSSCFTIKYVYHPENIHLEVKNNSSGGLENLDFDIKSKHIEYTDSKQTRGFILFNFNEVISQLKNNLNWNITLDDTCFNEDSNGSNFTINGFDYDLVNNGTALQVYFDIFEQEKMYNSSIYLNAKIEPNFYYDLDIIYKNFSFDKNTFNFFDEEIVKSFSFNAGEKIYKSAIINVLANSNNADNNFNNFFNGQSKDYFPVCSFVKDGYSNLYKNIVNLASVIRINDVIYSQAEMLNQANLIKQGLPMTKAIGKYTIYCNYQIQPFFAITYNTKTNDTNAITHDISFFDTGMNFEAKDILKNMVIDKNHRLESVTIDDKFILLSACSKDNVNPMNNRFTLLNTITFDNENYCIPVNVVISDDFIIKFDFYEQYKDRKGNKTPFATLQHFEGTAKVVDFLSIEKPTSVELQKVVLKTKEVPYALGFLGLVYPIDNEIAITESENGVFSYKVPYSFKSVKAQQSNGSDFSETQVCISKYSDWSMAFSGNDEPWGVEMLNHEDSTFRLNNADIKPEELYGLFAQATFKEQVKNINSWFSTLTNDGCVVDYTTKEVKGSSIYKFLDKLTIKTGVTFLDNVLNAPLSWLKIGCEVANDDNGTYYNHFFYLDGTSDLPFLSHSGATSVDDNDGATVNMAQNVLTSVKDFFTESKFGKVLKIVLGVVVGIIIVSLILKLITLIKKLFFNNQKKKYK